MCGNWSIHLFVDAEFDISIYKLKCTDGYAAQYAKEHEMLSACERIAPFEAWRIISWKPCSEQQRVAWENLAAMHPRLFRRMGPQYR